MEKNDILLAEFEGLKFQAYNDNHSYNTQFDTYRECLNAIAENKWEGFSPRLGWRTEPKYMTSMDWLMPIFEKIYNLGFTVQIARNECSIFWRGVEMENTALFQASNDFTLIETSSDTTVKATCEAFVQFIQWYNNIKLS